MLPSLRCIIIDDSPSITDLIQHYCSKISTIEYCISCNNALDGLKLISDQSFDIVFLDYNMPDLNGKGLLELKQDASKVIMITSHPSFAVDSYNYSAVVDYLLKPIEFERFYKAIEKIKHQNDLKLERVYKEFMFVKDGNKWIQIRIKDLIYIKSESNYVIFHLANQRVMSLSNLKDLEKELPSNFMRVHRSYIVNTKEIDFITSDEIGIQNILIPLGAKYIPAVKGLVIDTLS